MLDYCVYIVVRTPHGTEQEADVTPLFVDDGAHAVFKQITLNDLDADPCIHHEPQHRLLVPRYMRQQGHVAAGFLEACQYLPFKGLFIVKMLKPAARTEQEPLWPDSRCREAEQACQIDPDRPLPAQ